ncbi:unnamed protein product [Gulo gulo]|uniref:Uncharacterized protein n=1 Tax=Gulo gulo TaxID=48420 RepID=A0A9X9LTA1_GULGU|nr:unnamed protein product [Gulo gulo]
MGPEGDPRLADTSSTEPALPPTAHLPAASPHLKIEPAGIREPPALQSLSHRTPRFQTEVFNR